MDPHLAELYRRVGYDDPSAIERAAPGPAGALETHVRAAAAGPADPTVLTPERLERLRDAFERNPADVLERLREGCDSELTEDGVRTALENVRLAFESPGTQVEAMEAAAAHFERAVRLPDDFAFPGMDLDEIPIDPGDKKFESGGDWMGWLVHSGWPSVFPPEKVPFRRHRDAASGFEYALEEPTSGEPLEVGLFADFGTGLYHSRYIAKQFREAAFPYLIHLGDVYYNGTAEEFEENFIGPLSPVLDRSRLFMLVENHELLSGAKAYFEFIDRKREEHPDVQRQEGSYFRLRSDRFQILGLDTSYHERGRLTGEWLEWTENALREGRRDGCVNIVLSGYEPYEYGSTGHTDLLKLDLRRAADDGLIDLWFWGNTHYCALFDRYDRARVPFIGSCIGHGGYPYGRISFGKDAPAPIRFLETAARFPAETRIRQDRGNNGFCVMRLHADASVELEYRDWMANVRGTARMSREDHRSPLTIRSAELRPAP